MSAAFEPQTIRRMPCPASAAYTASATDADAVLTLPAQGAGLVNVVGAVCWSYSSAPTNGSLTVTDGGTVVFQGDIVDSGPGYADLSNSCNGADNQSFVFTLAAGGVGVTGKLNLLGVSIKAVVPAS